MNQIAIQPRLPMPAVADVSPQQWRVLTEAIFPAAKSPEAICLALDYCRARKLDIFKRPVHIVPMWNSALGREVETVWPGINELQVTAARTGKWSGMDEPKWGVEITRTFKGAIGKRGQERNVSIEMTFPEWCSVTVYRNVDGVRCAFAEPVYWEEAYSRSGRTEVPNEMWQKRVRGQLHKVAKAASLRAAFPEEIGNDYAAEEMEGKEIEAGGVVIDGSPVVEMSSPHEQEPPPMPVYTIRDAINDIEADFAAAETRDAVDAVLAGARCQKALDKATNGHKSRLDAIVKAALDRTAPVSDFPGDWPSVENDQNSEAALDAILEKRLP